MTPFCLHLLVSVVCSMFWFGPFNGFGHYDYVREISLKNSLFFVQ
jgi:hypothetical protein